jgi:hypothetical protein
MKYTIGIDPDSNRHGIAVYENGTLITCATATTIEIITGHVPYFRALGELQFAIENVAANSFVYGRNNQSSRAAQAKVGVSIGRCQQAQIELVRWLELEGVPCTLIKPTAGNWANNKPQFERVTGWTGRSNSDGRSAAFFGWLLLKTETSA